MTVFSPWYQLIISMGNLIRKLKPLKLGLVFKEMTEDELNKWDFYNVAW